MNIERKNEDSEEFVGFGPAGSERSVQAKVGEKKKVKEEWPWGDFEPDEDDDDDEEDL